MPHAPRQLVLISLDGYGISPTEEHNPVVLAKKPTMDRLMAQYPYGALDAAGLAVGLPWGQVGNSEVGHLTMGAGMVLYQNQPRVNLAVENGTFFQNGVLLKAIAHTKEHNSRLHVLGIASNGGVHGHIDHIKAVLQAAKQQGLKEVMIHAMTDGRDTPPQSGIGFLASLERMIKEAGVGTVATLCGRYWAMDRNNSWDRTQKAYELITKGTGTVFPNAEKALQAAYDQNIDDEMLEPCVVGKSPAFISPGDAVVITSYREDRARQIAAAIANDPFEGWERGKRIENMFVASFMEYEAGMPIEVIFPPEHITHPFGMLIADQGWTQLRIAESEKYAHVTYFFNGGSEARYEGEDRVLIPSPKVRTYDLKPDMSAREITAHFLAEHPKKKWDFTLINFANPDMVGHTGNELATIQAIEAVDECLTQILDYTEKNDIIVMITADHGNAEIIIDAATGKMDKEHSTSPVPLIIADPQRKREKSEQEIAMTKYSISAVGVLADIAPTMCELMGITPSAEMTGRSLLNDV